MKLFKIFVFSLSYCLSLLSQDIIEIHPEVGSSIDQSEKIKYGLFPYFSTQKFRQAHIERKNDSSFVIVFTLIPDSMLQKRISESELHWLRGQIDPKNYPRAIHPSDLIPLSAHVTETDTIWSLPPQKDIEPIIGNGFFGLGLGATDKNQISFSLHFGVLFNYLVCQFHYINSSELNFLFQNDPIISQNEFNLGIGGQYSSKAYTFNLSVEPGIIAGTKRGELIESGFLSDRYQAINYSTFNVLIFANIRINLSRKFGIDINGSTSVNKAFPHSRYGFAFNYKF